METANGTPTAAPGVGPGSPGGAVRGRLWSALRIAEVRLRLPIVLIVTAVLLGRWDAMRNQWDRMTRRTPVESIAGHAISTDTEYFCPMDPGILSDWPGRCGVCNMALVRRRKGEAVMLPDGVVARMQISPYRIQLAGIRTAPAEFRPLMREWTTSGLVTRRGGAATVVVDVPPRQAPWIAEGSRAEVSCADADVGETLAGRVGSIVRDNHKAGEVESATVSIERPPERLRDGMIARVRFRQAVAELEPFCSMPRNPPVPATKEPRRLYACADHADSTAIEPSPCPLDRKDRELRVLGELERVRWWCPMHPDVTADRAGLSCRACGGMSLRPRVITYSPPGQVLAVPQSAVVDTGERKVVFVEGMPGLFDGVEVVLGSRCGEYYPVVRGIEPGGRIAVAGAFLLDAETRLNPSLAAGYFGASSGRRAEAPAGGVSSKDERGPAAALDTLGVVDRALAGRQKTCPVTGLALGSMGTPEREVVSGRVVLLCCGGCRSKLLAEPAKYLARLPAP
jgi:membrane fusion protein, copper/silver efflux system